MEFLNAKYDSADTMLLGRKLADGFINYWESALDKNPDTPFVKQIVAMPKVVFTKTLDKSPWNNTTLAKGNLAEEIANLKKSRHGGSKDIIVYGGAGFVSSLIKEGLIDEYHLFVNPTAIGNGMTIFKSLDRTQKFSVIQSRFYSCGVTVLSYKPKND